MMKRILAVMLVVCTLFALTACTDGPLIATATPVPTPEPLFEENVIWPETSLTKLLPHFQPTLEIASQSINRGDEIFFGAFTEYDVSILNNYLTKLEEAGFTVTTEAGSGQYVAVPEDGSFKVTLYHDGLNGTIQIVRPYEEAAAE